MIALDLFVPGVPKPKGSWRAITSATTGKAFLVPNDKKSKPWEHVVRYDAMHAWTRPLLQGPTHVGCFFHMPRPKKHYRTGKHAKDLRDDAPVWHINTPDADKLLRCVLDALTGVVIRDDSIIASIQTGKTYQDTPGVRIVVEEL